ncbi:hypothetical protein NG2371_04497 [Nocardia gamkensis]|nr:hypothetical protein [Nocardia gamkensis]
MEPMTIMNLLSSLAIQVFSLLGGFPGGYPG